MIVIIKGEKSKLIFNNLLYLMRNGNIEVYDNGLVEMGNNVSIGPNYCIYNHDHDFSKMIF